MCYPMLIMAAATVLQGYQAKQQGEYQEGVGRYNARQQENEAIRTRNKGVTEENKQRRATSELLARQRAQLGASGIDIGSGSALQLQQDTITLGEADALTIRTNFLEGAGTMADQAVLTRNQGEAARIAGNNAFTGSIITAAGQGMSSGVADKWFTPKSSAMNPNLTSNTAYVKQF